MDIHITKTLPETIARRAITPASPNYDEARALYNGMIDKKPAAIVPCRNADEIAEVVAFARESNVLLAIRGGGHNGPGLGSCDGGIVIDCSPMTGIDIDVDARTVSVEPGLSQGEVDRATAPYGLHVPAGIVSSTGIAGLTLGGGHGYLAREYGLTIDNLLEAEMVLADGRRVTANERENEDLFWAIRGGGGNFGVVTKFTYRLREVSDVLAGPVFYDTEHTARIMRWYREVLPSMPRKLSMTLGLKRCPSAEGFPEELWNRPVCALICCYDGPEEEARGVVEPLLAELPEPLMNGLMEMPFVDWQGAFDPLLPKGLQWYWKGDYIHELSDGAIEEHLKFGTDTPSNLSLMHLYPIDGAPQERAADATAWGTRDATWSMVIAGIDPDPANAAKVMHWAKDYWTALHRHNRHGGAYVNFMMEDEGEERIRAAYGTNYDGLVAVKRKYDPDNLFRVNQNIRP
ncbi:FAD-binding oxidoreductase [Sphingomicrobium nitratireducens]|uniref:FAD-binding oxidoreductase n=1 Tax=Sphingomicrobium nitratireducens TaxID=2964666 RepID=UPI00223F6562|nr:FAD-binding oxidoreductase [Sphingomicrobium nitratireducens]